MWIACVLGLALQAAPPGEADLLAAIRNGDAAAVKGLLDKGVSAKAKYRYDRTALAFAADRGQVEIVQLLLDRGADPNAKDTFYQSTAMGDAARHGHIPVVRLLLARGATDVGGVVFSAAADKNVALMEAVLASGRLTPTDLSLALDQAVRREAPAVAEALRKAGAVESPKAEFGIPAEMLAGYTGKFREVNGTQEVVLSVEGGVLQLAFGGRAFKMGAFDATHFKLLEAPVLVDLQVAGGRATGLVAREIGEQTVYTRVPEEKP
jgi:ankyrin repeat protein